MIIRKPSIEIFLLSLVFALIAIWAFPHTIAIRNILLLICLPLALVCLKRHLPISYRSSIAIIFLIILFIWMVAHYLIFSFSPAIELKELTSTGLRSFIGCLIAIAIAAVMKSKKYSFEWLSTAFYIYSFGIVGIYLFQSNSLGAWLIPNEFLGRNFSNSGINKVNPAFIASIALAVAYANISVIFEMYQDLKTILIKIWPHVLGVFASFASVFVVNTKNGVAICMFLTGIFIVVNIFKIFKNFKKNKYLFFVLVIAIVLCGVISLHHSSKASPGWKTMIRDAQISIQIDKYKNWDLAVAAYFKGPSRVDAAIEAGQDPLKMAGLIGGNTMSGYYNDVLSRVAAYNKRLEDVDVDNLFSSDMIVIMMEYKAVVYL
jgi:hypothetical protein